MANTYTQVHIQTVFTVQNRFSLIKNSFKDELFKYITGIVQRNNHKVLAINGMPDHVHLFFGMRPTQSLSDLMQDVKGISSKWINQKGFIKGSFSWQEGYGGFSYSRSHVNNVIDYIKNQEIHHKNMTFIEEYNKFLKAFNVPYEEQYLFTPVDYSNDF